MLLKRDRNWTMPRGAMLARYRKATAQSAKTVKAEVISDERATDRSIARGREVDARRQRSSPSGNDICRNLFCTSTILVK
jgi:hypothetical protein